MLRLERSEKLAFFFLILAAGINSEIALAQIAGIGENGWHTWQVDAVEGAPEMCCFSWRSGNATRKQCDLDGRNGGFSGSDEASSSDSDVQIFALMEAGVATRIRVLSTNCPVIADSGISDLGPIDTDDSIDWLQRSRFARHRSDCRS